MAKLDLSIGRWWDDMWSVTTGCTPVSEACEHCYAMPMLKRFENIHGHDDVSHVMLHPERLDQPAKRKKPTIYFVSGMSDLFHADVPWEFIYRAFSVMHDAPQHTFIVLTKRAKKMASLCDVTSPNVWLGVTVENQERADDRLPHLIRLADAGWNTWLSCEPLLGPINFRWTPYSHQATGETYREYLDRSGSVNHLESLSKIGGIIAGGESGASARPSHPDWLRSLRDQCSDAGVPFFFKQWGGTNKKRAGRLLDGIEHNDLAWGGHP